MKKTLKWLIFIAYIAAPKKLNPMVCNQRQAEPEWHKCYHISRNIGKHRRQTKLPEVINKPLDFFKWYKIIPVRA